MLGAISPSVPPLGAKRTTGAQRQVIGTQMKDKAPYPDPPWADSGDPKSQGPKVNFFFFFTRTTVHHHLLRCRFLLLLLLLFVIWICSPQTDPEKEEARQTQNGKFETPAF